MAQTRQSTLEKIYKELKAMRDEIHRIEYAVIPVENLSPEERASHAKDLENALKGKRMDFREL